MNTNHTDSTSLAGRIDWITVIVPFVLILFLCVSFVLAPELCGQLLSSIRSLFGDTLGLCYLIIGLGVFVLSLYHYI